jgi:hypothetical protein
VIGKVTRGKSIGGLLRYLYGPGIANEHTDPHLVASWLGDDGVVLDALEPALDDGRHDVRPLSDRLALALQLRPGAIDRPVWQCSMRVAEGDRTLTDAEWATVARDVVERTGFAPADDPGGCRWVAVRHADDHIHIAVVLARQDGERVELFRDWPKVHAAARNAERRLGLQLVASPDRTATVAPTRAEAERALREGRPMASRAWLTRQVGAAVAGSTSPAEFEASLRRSGVLVSWRESQRTAGQITGYAVARPGDVDATGQQVWFGGSKLSPDLSLPRLRARWQEVTPGPARPGQKGSERQLAVPRPRPPMAGEQRVEILRRAGRALRHVADAPLTPQAAVSAGEVAAALAGVVEGVDGGPLTEAAEHLSRAARQPAGRRPHANHRVHPLRTVAAELSLLGHLLPGEARHALLLVANLIRIADVLRRVNQAGHHPPPEGPLAQRAIAALQAHAGQPAAGERDRVAAVLDASGAQDVFDDPAWPALASHLRDGYSSPETAAAALRVAIDQRELDSARSPAAVLLYRLDTESAPHQGPTRGPVAGGPRVARARRR